MGAPWSAARVDGLMRIAKKLMPLANSVKAPPPGVRSGVGGGIGGSAGTCAAGGRVNWGDVQPIAWPCEG
ncbi:hypothetical protein GCM10007079_40670 [Nocardiopsis terrae]|nr:hypothetical protein GCM10007079_40670 [Nocardiopsis terrae]